MEPRRHFPSAFLGNGEAYLATALYGNLGGFKPGDVFIQGAGHGVQVIRITDGGRTVIDPWFRWFRRRIR